MSTLPKKFTKKLTKVQNKLIKSNNKIGDLAKSLNEE